MSVKCGGVRIGASPPNTTFQPPPSISCQVFKQFLPCKDDARLSRMISSLSTSYMPLADASTSSTHTHPTHTERSSSSSHEMSNISVISTILDYGQDGHSHAMAQHTLGMDLAMSSNRMEWSCSNFHCMFCLSIGAFIIFWTLLLLR